MKIVLATLFVLVMIAPTAPAQTPKTSLEISCPVTLPRQRDVSTVFGMANFSQVYATRERLMYFAQRACRRGSGNVRVIADDERSGPIHDMRVPSSIK